MYRTEQEVALQRMKRLGSRRLITLLHQLLGLWVCVMLSQICPAVARANSHIIRRSCRVLYDKKVGGQIYPLNSMLYTVYYHSHTCGYDQFRDILDAHANMRVDIY